LLLIFSSCLAAAQAVRECLPLASHPGDAVKAAEMFHKARKKDAKVFLFPETVMNLLAYGRLQGGGKQEAVELFKLNVEAYPASANAQDSLSDGYLALGQKDLALAAEEKCLQLLPADPAPADFKAQIKAAAEKKVAQLMAGKTP
jgi:tetratricopeptide (TPR) repeat protein